MQSQLDHSVGNLKEGVSHCKCQSVSKLVSICTIVGTLQYSIDMYRMMFTLSFLYAINLKIYLKNEIT